VVKGVNCRNEPNDFIIGKGLAVEARRSESGGGELGSLGERSSRQAVLHCLYLNAPDSFSCNSAAIWVDTLLICVMKVAAKHTQYLIFTALHGMQMRYSDDNSVCLSVRLSVTRLNCDKTVERSVRIFIPYERSFSLVF